MPSSHVLKHHRGPKSRMRYERGMGRAGVRGYQPGARIETGGLFLNQAQRTSLRPQETVLGTKKIEQGQSHDLRRAAQLRDAVARRAQERGDAPSDLARILGISLGHWYRVKKEPQRLSRLTLEHLDAVARYVAWPRTEVMVAIGWLRPEEVSAVLSSEDVLRGALSRLSASGLANGLEVPLERAAPEHQRLMARMLLAIESAITSPAAEQAKE
jgi:hypothetical protein